MLDAAHSATHIASSTGYGIGTISRLHSKHCSQLSKLSPTNIHHAVHLIGSGNASTAIDVTKTLSNIINQPLSVQTVHNSLKKAGMKAVARQKKPLLSNRHT